MHLIQLSLFGLELSGDSLEVLDLGGCCCCHEDIGFAILLLLLIVDLVEGSSVDIVGSLELSLGDL